MVYSPAKKLKLSLHPDFVADLDALWRTDFNAAAEIAIVIQEIENSEAMLAVLTTHRHVTESNFPVEIQKWQEVYRQGFNIWRLKFMDMGSHGTPYRLIYAFDPGEPCYHFLAIAPRTFDYEPTSAVGLRIQTAYKLLLSA